MKIVPEQGNAILSTSLEAWMSFMQCFSGLVLLGTSVMLCDLKNAFLRSKIVILHEYFMKCALISSLPHPINSTAVIEQHKDEPTKLSLFSSHYRVVESICG